MCFHFDGLVQHYSKSYRHLELCCTQLPISSQRKERSIKRFRRFTFEPSDSSFKEKKKIIIIIVTYEISEKKKKKKKKKKIYFPSKNGRISTKERSLKLLSLEMSKQFPAGRTERFQPAVDTHSVAFLHAATVEVT